MAKHTYDYGLIGNCAYQAHIHKEGTISWMCWPRFDSSFIFGKMLDDEKGGEFSIIPTGGITESKQYYIENTNVLRTEIESPDGRMRITDFAPRFLQYDRYYKPLMLIRKIEPLSGTPKAIIHCDPRGDYGNIKPKHYNSSNHIEYEGLEYDLRLTTNIPITPIMNGNQVVIHEPKYLVLTYGAPLEAPLIDTCENFLKKTVDYWRGWVKSMSINPFHQKMIIRSALALKIHQFEDTGAIIAAGTTSLPESPGSGRCWDYRFCWPRDTYYTLTAFNNIGHFEELEKYFNYFLNLSPDKNGRFQPLYKITGESEIEEVITDLKGYKGNKPVRIGNQAYTHIQNDVYGQMLLSLLPLYSDHRFIYSERVDSVKLIFDLLKKISKIIDEPDAGLWEFRNLAQHHSYTYLFHWAGASAALKIGHIFGNKKMIKLSQKIMEQAIEKIEQCFDHSKGAYTQAIGSPHLDASNLQLITLKYLHPDSKKAQSHLKALETELRTEEGLFFRYKHSDDFGAPETTFLICAFWYVEALVCVNRMDEAIEVFERLAGFGNHLGLLSEDVDGKDGSQWGNFPQAYSHVGLVNAAYKIAHKLDRPNFLSPTS